MIRLLPTVLFLLFASIVCGEEEQVIDPMKIPWPNCGVGSNSRLPCADKTNIEKESKPTVEEISEEEIKKFFEQESKKKSTNDMEPSESKNGQQ